MTDTQTIIRTFRLNKDSLDQTLGEAETEETPEILAPRLSAFVGAVPKAMKRKGYEFMVGTNGLYRGMPERVMAIDHNAPFMVPKEYWEKSDRDFLEVAEQFELPYEPEDRFVDYAKRRLG